MVLTPKQIGRAAGRIFEVSLPASWVFRSQEDQDDYGVDGEIELITENEKATGFIFKAQIKGQNHVEIINNGESASFSISVERLNYYMHQLDIPIVLIVVDITTKMVYWKCLQDDNELLSCLSNAISNGSKTITVHLSTSNTLPEKNEELILSVSKTMDWLKLHAVNKIQKPIADLIKNSSSNLISELLRRNKEMNFYLYNEQYERLLLSGKNQELYDTAIVIFQSLSELVETRFNSGLYIEKVLMSAQIDEDVKNEHLFNLFSAIISIVRKDKGKKHLRVYSVFLLRMFLLKGLIDLDFHAQLTKIQTEADPLTSWIVRQGNNNLVIQTATCVQKIIYSMNKIIMLGDNNLIVNCLTRCCNSLALYAYRLKLDKNDKQSLALYQWLEFCLKIALKSSKENEDQTSYANLIILYGKHRYYCENYREYIEEALVLSGELDDQSVRDEIKSIFDKLIFSKEDENSQYNPETELKFFTERAIAMGFKIDDPNDDIGKLIKTGLEDYNPERVIKNCEHLYMFTSNSLGIPARTLGLYSAASKFLVCTKKNHVMGGWRLDDIYSFIIGGGFKEQYCKGCEECSPRPDSWKWTSKWQEQQVEIHKELVGRLNRIL